MYDFLSFYISYPFFFFLFSFMNSTDMNIFTIYQFQVCTFLFYYHGETFSTITF